jgi:pimeloyl-ACP methyl ester carboxylesterase
VRSPGFSRRKEIFSATYAKPDDLWLRVHFTPSEASQRAGAAFLERSRRRVENRDPEVTQAAALRQRTAIAAWGAKCDKAWDYLKTIRQRSLVVNGSDDVIIYPVNSIILQQHLPNAKLILYPDSAHGSLFQYPEMFVRDVESFLDQEQWS